MVITDTSSSLDPGDTTGHRGDTVPLDAGSNTVSAGDAVNFDGSGNIQRTTSNSDDFIGVVGSQTDSGDSIYPVHIAGLVTKVVLASDGSCSTGDVLMPSGTDDGTWNTADSDMVVDASTSSNVYTNHPFALESGGNDEEVLVAMR
jgi:hypothetical protein